MAEGFRTFGCYILFKEYTADVFGHLYRAGELGADGTTRTLFLRVLDGKNVSAKSIIEAFPTGRAVARELASVNLVSGADFVEHGGVPAMVFDFVPSQPLRSIVQRTRLDAFPVSTDNALLIAEKLTHALAAGLTLERGGSPMVHGLLHPSLVMVTTDGEPMVAGFGVAEALLELLDDPQAAENLQPYLAPEILLTRTPSKRGDVYSLGALLVELLTGEPLPPDPELRAGVLDDRALAHEERPIPADIRSMLQRAIAPRPEDRYSSAVDFKKELDRLLYGGAYSPTTFNLALFLDRLFRSEIDAEDRQRTIDESLDLRPLLTTKSQTADEHDAGTTRAGRGLTGWWFGTAALVVAAAIALGSWYALTRAHPQEPPPPAPPTAEQLAERRLEHEARLQRMVEELVQQKMADKEDEISRQLRDCQDRNEELRRRLRELEIRADE